MDPQIHVSGKNWIRDLLFTYLPDELKSLPNWVVWKYVTRSNGGGKSVPTKVPFEPQSNRAAKATDTTTWASYNTALDAKENYEGLGFVLAPPFVVIDLDKVRNPETGQIEDWAEHIVSELDSYTELSPSGTGFHIWVKGKLPSGGNRKGRVEMYCEKRYMTVTGEHVEGTPLTIEERDLTGIHARMVRGELDPDVRAKQEARPKPSTSSGDKFEALMAGHWQGQYKSQSEADLALCRMLVSKVGPNPEKIDAEFRKSGLCREKWDRADYRGSTIEKAIQSYQGRATPVDLHSAPSFLTERMSNIEAKRMKWLWPSRIPKGKLAIFAGNPDTGKTTVACDVIARLTTGKSWPDAKNEEGPTNVLLLSAEDDPADTLRPRLEAAGADLERIHIVEAVSIPDKKAGSKQRTVALDNDLGLLEKKMHEIGNVGLVIIDPLTSYLGKIDLNKEAELRRALVPIKDLCERTDVTVLALTHFNKRADVGALHRVGGAVAMTGVARAAWLFMRDPEAEEDEFLMVLAKNNLAKRRTGLRYTIAEHLLPTGGVPVIAWKGEYKGSADRIIETSQNAQEKKEARVKRFLEDRLKDGPKPSEELLTEANSLGIGRTTLFDMKKELGIAAKKVRNRWFWFRQVNSNVQEGGEHGADWTLDLTPVDP